MRIIAPIIPDDLIEGKERNFPPVNFVDGQGTMYGLAPGDLNKDGYPDSAAAHSDAPNVVYFSGK